MNHYYSNYYIQLKGNDFVLHLGQFSPFLNQNSEESILFSMVLSVLGHFGSHTMRSINLLQQKLYETFSKYVVLGNNICQEFFCHSMYIL